jgi:CopA family copper-resistance protein
VRLRFNNAAAQTFFDIRIPGLKMLVVQADGQNVEPVLVDEFRIGLAETYDVIVTPEEGVYTLFAQTMDRTGYARGTLATDVGMTAAVPVPDKAVALSMMDMMGDMSVGMDTMDHSAHGSMVMGGKKARVHHASTEYGPSVDMRVDTPRTNLDDPGIGLRNNGRRVLTYADLHSIGGSRDPRKPAREIELHLTGNMKRYSWSLDGLEFGKSSPVHFRYGERLRVIFVNDTMMSHPMHLHGMWIDLESPDGGFQVRKHTIIVQSAQRVTFLVTADAPGRWAMHCHLFYHMHAGMMREVVVA